MCVGVTFKCVMPDGENNGFSFPPKEILKKSHRSRVRGKNENVGFCFFFNLKKNLCLLVNVAILCFKIQLNKLEDL